MKERRKLVGQREFDFFCKSLCEHLRNLSLQISIANETLERLDEKINALNETYLHFENLIMTTKKRKLDKRLNSHN